MLDVVKQPLAQAKGQAFAELCSQILAQHVEQAGKGHDHKKQPGQKGHVVKKPLPSAQVFHISSEGPGQIDGFGADYRVDDESHQSGGQKGKGHSAGHGGNAAPEVFPAALHHFPDEAAAASGAGAGVFFLFHMLSSSHCCFQITSLYHSPWFPRKQRQGGAKAAVEANKKRSRSSA